MMERKQLNLRININFLLEKLTTNYIVKNLFTSIMSPMRLIQLNILKFFLHQAT